ncbi:MAG: conserved hypothetical protein [Methanobrevibacter sp. CfCl-M3]
MVKINGYFRNLYDELIILKDLDDFDIFEVDLFDWNSRMLGLKEVDYYMDFYHDIIVKLKVHA